MAINHKKHCPLTSEEKKEIWTKAHLDGMKIRDIRDKMGLSFGAVQKFSYGEGAAFAKSLVYGYDLKELDNLYAEASNKVRLKKFKLKKFKSYVATIPEAGLLDKDEFESLYVLFLANVQHFPKVVELKEKIRMQTELLGATRYSCGRKRRALVRKRKPCCS